MKVQSLGHVVLKVTDLQRSEDFYSGVLGLPVCARFDEQGMNMTFFTLGNHHDLAILQSPRSGHPAGRWRAIRRGRSGGRPSPRGVLHWNVAE
jgi:catechol 2,3-dioxygenase-like lactoylglutathione lyase family enzyme